MHLPTAADAARLDTLLRETGGSLVLHVSLEEAWHYCQGHPEGGRLFVHVLDLQLHVAALQRETAVIAQVVNLDLLRADEPRVSLRSPEDFAIGVRAFEAMTSFILRYRAIWDKLMGTLVLLLDPRQYQAFCAAKSRKKFFVELLHSRGGRWPTYANQVSETIEVFDRKFRTSEAHGSGVARTLAFQPASTENERWNDFFSASNALNYNLIALARVFTPGPQGARGESED